MKTITCRNDAGLEAVFTYDHDSCEYFLVSCDGIYSVKNAVSTSQKGTHAAIKRVAYFLREYYRKTGSNEGYVVLVDFSNFFGNMKHWHIRRILEDHSQGRL